MTISGARTLRRVAGVSGRALDLGEQKSHCVRGSAETPLALLSGFQIARAQPGCTRCVETWSSSHGSSSSQSFGARLVPHLFLRRVQHQATPRHLRTRSKCPRPAKTFVSAGSESGPILAYNAGVGGRTRHRPPNRVAGQKVFSSSARCERTFSAPAKSNKNPTSEVSFVVSGSA
jgi:hypothetical protein